MFENKFSKKHILYRFEPDAVRGLVLLTFSSSTLYSQNNKLTQADNEWPGIIRVNDLITMTFIWKAALAWWRMPKEALRKLRCVKCGFSTFQATLRKDQLWQWQRKTHWWMMNMEFCLLLVSCGKSWGLEASANMYTNAKTVVESFNTFDFRNVCQQEEPFHVVMVLG